MTLSALLLTCATGCTQPLEPAPPRPERIQASGGVATDSACRTLTITLVGSNSVDVAFPDRTQCGSGLVLVPAGAPSRGGPGKRNVSVPLRVLNASGYAFQSPASVVLSPDARVVVDPAGQAASKIIPQNADSVRAGSGAWVWRVGAGGTVAVGDSTAAKTLVIRLDSPVTSGRVSMVMEADQITGAGWTLLTWKGADFDTTMLVQRPGTDVVLYRTALMLRFHEGVSDQGKVAFVAQYGLNVLGVTQSGLFYVSFPDPGASIEAYDTFANAVRAHPSVRLVLPLCRAGCFIERGAARFPNDGLKRASWLFGQGQVDSLWAMRAIRAPQAWGCETGTYGPFVPRVALVEFTHNPSHPELLASFPSYWAPDDAALVGVMPVSVIKRDSALRHAAETSGLLSASGDDERGIAGVSWRTDLHLLSLRSPGRRSVYPMNWHMFAAQVRQRAPRILSLSVEAELPLSASAASRSDYVTNLTLEWKDLLDSIPTMLVVVAAGNEGHVSGVANYIATVPGLPTLRAGLLTLRQDPTYRNRIVVVSGTSPGNNTWSSSNVFTDATDIAAPAQHVLVMDTVVAGAVGIAIDSGTSLAAPMVAGTAALLWTMDPTLTPQQVKDYLLRGAQVPRHDSTTALLTPRAPVTGMSGVYQLDAYGSLQLLSKERAGTPICGYPVSARHGAWVLLHKEGPQSPPSDSIKVPKAADFLGYIGVAPGGRRLSAFAQTDSMNGGGQSIIDFNLQGVRLGARIGAWGGRHYMEKHIADHRQVGGLSTVWQEVALRRSDGALLTIINLRFPDGTLVGAAHYSGWLDMSPDGRFVAFSRGEGVHVQRFADNTTTFVGPGGMPRWSKDGTKLVVFSSDSLYNFSFQAYQVDSTAHGGFTLTQSVTGSGRHLRFPSRFAGDDAVFYSVESSPPPVVHWIAARAGASLGTKGLEMVVSAVQDWQLANVAVAKP